MKIIRKIITLILLVVLGYSTFELYKIYKTNHDEHEALKEINEIATPKDSHKDITGEDILKMKEINSDVVGYLKFDTELIAEPIVQTIDNSYYLNYDINHSYNDFGTVFMDYRNTLEDTNMIMYGHAGIYAGTQKFSNLNTLLGNDDEYKKNSYFNFYTQDEVRRYQISYIIKNNNSEIFNHQIRNFDTEDEFNKWISFAKENNSITGLNEIKYGDKFITLQTCIHGGGNDKVIVIAKEISRKKY